jgi:thiol-disulfide isomerase/thioredoxin
MRRSMLGGLAALLMAFPLAADEKKDRKQQFAEVKEEFDKQMKEFESGTEGIRTQKAFFEYSKKKGLKAKVFLAKLLPLVEENPKDELSLEILRQGVIMHLSEPPTGEDRKVSPEARRVVKFLAEAHAASPKMKDMARSFAGEPLEELKPLFEAVLAKNEDKEAKAFSAFALANLGYEASDDAKKSAEERKAAAQEAEKYFESLIKDHGDVKMGKQTMAEVAKPFLTDVRTLRLGMKVPDVTAENLDGKKEKLSDYKGKVVVLDIWATWCGPCRAMIPHEREMVGRLKSKPFALISASADVAKEDLQKFLEKEKMPWNHWWVGNEEGLVKDWNVRFYPTIYVIDAKGVIRHKNLREAELEEAVVALIKEAEGK